MRIEITPDQKIIDFQNKLIVNEILTDKRKFISQAFIFIVVLFVLSFLFFYFNFDGIGTIFIIFSISYLFYIYSKYEALLAEKSRLVSYFPDYPEESGNGNFIFTNKELRYYDNSICSFTNWDDFENYKIVKRNILLFINKDIGDIVIISKLEVGEEDFEKIITFINKIGIKNE